jgi:pimeloyl-ACP methyl ester carboxylesterase
LTTFSHVTAPTQFVEADGIRFAYRRFGAGPGVPVVFVQHFLGNLDTFDPAITDAVAAGREVVLFDNTGVGLSGGIAPDTIAGLAGDAEAFVDALGLTRVDILGHSMGGHVSQQIAADRPDLVRKVILVGTGPRGGEGMGQRKPEVAALFTAKYERQDEMWLPVFFSPSARSQAAGRRYLDRIRTRVEDRDVPVSDQTRAAHTAARNEWGVAAADGFGYLTGIRQPALVVNGSHDIIVATVNSYLLQQNLPNAELVLYPDSGHGAHFQYPQQFLREALAFLDGPEDYFGPLDPAPPGAAALHTATA